MFILKKPEIAQIPFFAKLVQSASNSCILSKELKMSKINK